MKKTGLEIELDIYKLLAASLRTAINGEVHNSSGRDTDSEKEDAVILFMTGKDEQVQEGVVVVNIYVPKKRTKSGRMAKHTNRCRALESELMGIIDAIESTEYYLKRRKIIQTYDEESINQSFVNAEIYFKRITT